MIEVEKKFRLDEAAKSRLLDGAKDLGETSLTDTYYDTPDYKLSTSDHWLRKRNDDFELKVPIQTGERNHPYHELNSEVDIRQTLELDMEGSMEDALAKKRIAPFGSWTTTRHAYEKDGFTIDVDHVDYGTFAHDVVEIELLVERESDIPDATDRILSFAQQHGISMDQIKGKAATYLERERPEHYKVLKKVMHWIE